MRDDGIEAEARRASMAVVAALEAIQQQRWVEAEQALAEIVLIAAQLRRQIGYRSLRSPEQADAAMSRFERTVIEEASRQARPRN